MRAAGVVYSWVDYRISLDSRRTATRGRPHTPNHEAVMFPPIPDELIVADESPGTTADGYEEHTRHLDRCRRVRVGPTVVVVFEDRRTLWFRVRELAHLARFDGPERVGPQLTWYRSLLPGRDRLLASVALRGPDARPAAELAVELRAGDHVIPGRFLTDSAGDRIIGLVRWAEFRFAPADRDALADRSVLVTLVVTSAGRRHESDPFSDEVRDSLLADLTAPAAN